MNKIKYKGIWYDIETRTDGFYLFGKKMVDLNGKILDSAITDYQIFD